MAHQVLTLCSRIVCQLRFGVASIRRTSRRGQRYLVLWQHTWTTLLIKNPIAGSATKFGTTLSRSPTYTSNLGNAFSAVESKRPKRLERTRRRRRSCCNRALNLADVAAFFFCASRHARTHRRRAHSCAQIPFMRRLSTSRSVHSLRMGLSAHFSPKYLVTVTKERVEVKKISIEKWLYDFNPLTN